MDTIAANGVEIAFEEAGAGDTIVLVGGSGMTTAVWDLSIKPHLLQAGHRVITFDSRGTGESGAPAPPCAAPSGPIRAFSG